MSDYNVIDTDVEAIMKESFIQYSMAVIVSRALPDVRDGLKPVHRRILYTMYENGLTPDQAYRKCADTVGSVLGKYHPHGDASVYDALVRLAQKFSMRYPLVDGHGNFGSVDGDPPAAYRYTEAKMAKMSVNMLTDINKTTVDFQSNYDDRLKEPVVLPSRFPNLLCNGSVGIAVGMATNIPPHNLHEVIEGMKTVMKNPDCTLDERSMEYSFCRSNLLKELLYCRIRDRKIKNENTAEIPCAIRVAIAAPNTPRPSPATIQRSIKIFSMDEKISSPSGILDSPIEVNMVERMLYINRNGKPTK